MIGTERLEDIEGLIASMKLPAGLPYGHFSSDNLVASILKE